MGVLGYWHVIQHETLADIDPIKKVDELVIKHMKDLAQPVEKTYGPFPDGSIAGICCKTEGVTSSFSCSWSFTYHHSEDYDECYYLLRAHQHPEPRSLDELEDGLRFMHVSYLLSVEIAGWMNELVTAGVLEKAEWYNPYLGEKKAKKK